MAGWSLDYLIVMIPGLTLVGLALAHEVQSLPGFIGAVAADTGWSQTVKLFTHHSAAGFGEAAGKEWLWFILPLLMALVAVPILQFVYLAVLLAWRGRTVGMMVVDSTLYSGSSWSRPGKGQACARAALVTFVETGLVTVALVVMLFGQFSIGLLLWAATIGLFWLDVLPTLAAGRRTLVDRITMTAAVRRGLYAVATAKSVDAARRASTAAATVGRTAAGVAIPASRAAATAATGAAVVAARAVTDVAAITGDFARQGATSIVQSAPVQHVLDSRAAQQAQAIGAAGVDRARDLGSQANDHARRVGGRVRALWEVRQARRQIASGTPPVHDQFGPAADEAGPLDTVVSAAEQQDEATAAPADPGQ